MITFVISLKLLLALLLTSVPLFFWLYVKPRSKEDSKYHNLFRFLAAHSDKLTKLKKKLDSIIDSFGNGLIYSKKIRKFYIVLMVIGMLIVEITDLQISRYVARWITTVTGGNIQSASSYLFMYPALSHPMAEMAAVVITLACLSYRISNYYLTQIHNSIWLFTLNCVLIIVLCCISNQRCIVLGEVMYIMLTAAVFYLDYFYNEKEGKDGSSRGSKEEARSNVKDFKV